MKEWKAGKTLVLFDLAYHALYESGAEEAAYAMREAIRRFRSKEVRSLGRAFAIPDWRGRSGMFTGRVLVPGWGRLPARTVLRYRYLALRKAGFGRGEALERLAQAYLLSQKRLEGIIDTELVAMRRLGPDPLA